MSGIDVYYCYIYNSSIMSKSVINFKIDTDVKREAQKLAKELGLPLSSIVNSQLRQLLRTRSFELNATSVMSPMLQAVLAEVESDRKTAKHITTTHDLAGAYAHLDSL